jgi:hypothetical protein
LAIGDTFLIQTTEAAMPYSFLLNPGKYMYLKINSRSELIYAEGIWYDLGNSHLMQLDYASVFRMEQTYDYAKIRSPYQSFIVATKII